MPTRLTVNLKNTVDHSYPVLFGISIERTARDIASWHDGAVFIITDTNVAPLYGFPLLHALGKYGLRTEQIIVPAGEESKNRRMKEKIEDNLIRLKADRQSLIIALGGGVIGDLAGFIAATFLRGVPFVQIPTSLLAQVDSSVGGKVAVDHPAGKNLIGAFYQPKKVYIDVATLDTLPEEEFRSGMAEVIKYGAIMDERLFSLLERESRRIRRRDHALLTKIIARCCTLKAGVVEKDERESGLRRILNFGHTIGHAIESLSAYAVRHGEAIAIGMVVEAALAVNHGKLAPAAAGRLASLLQRYNLPVSIPDRMNHQDIIGATLSDKKMKDGAVQYTLLSRIGKAEPGIALLPELILTELQKFSS